MLLWVGRTLHSASALVNTWRGFCVVYRLSWVPVKCLWSASDTPLQPWGGWGKRNVQCITESTRVQWIVKAVVKAPPRWVPVWFACDFGRVIACQSNTLSMKRKKKKHKQEYWCKPPPSPHLFPPPPLAPTPTPLSTPRQTNIRVKKRSHLCMSKKEKEKNNSFCIFNEKCGDESNMPDRNTNNLTLDTYLPKCNRKTMEYGTCREIKTFCQGS